MRALNKLDDFSNFVVVKLGKNLMKLYADRAEEKININNSGCFSIPATFTLICARARTDKAT